MDPGKGRFTWSADSVDRLLREVATEGYRAVHHSDAFEAGCHRAYGSVLVTLVSAALP